MKKILIVGGTFDRTGGRASGVVRELTEVIRILAHEEVVSVNGGPLDFLPMILDKTKESDIVIWMPNISNEEDKLVGTIKVGNPKCLLVISKNNIDDGHDIYDLTQRQLAVKSNLMIEIKKSPVSSRFIFSVLDPLGNQFVCGTNNIDDLGRIIYDRLTQLSWAIRIPSVSVGPEGAQPTPPTEFFDVVQKHAKTFQKLIYGNKSVERLLGNASFRCAKGGFPSFRQDDLVYVSRRNIDKANITMEGFVPVILGWIPDAPAAVRYYGNNKPSVDTPVQLCLYSYFPKAKYMLHSHVYVKDAPFTRGILPCGDLREAMEIVNVVGCNPDYVNFSINLKGHGSISIADNVDFLRDVKYMKRPFPESPH